MGRMEGVVARCLDPYCCSAASVYDLLCEAKSTLPSAVPVLGTIKKIKLLTPMVPNKPHWLYNGSCGVRCFNGKNGGACSTVFGDLAEYSEGTSISSVNWALGFTVCSSCVGNLYWLLHCFPCAMYLQETGCKCIKLFHTMYRQLGAIADTPVVSCRLVMPSWVV